MRTHLEKTKLPQESSPCIIAALREMPEDNERTAPNLTLCAVCCERFDENDKPSSVAWVIVGRSSYCLCKIIASYNPENTKQM